MKYAESQLRQLCQERHLNWDIMSEDEQEQFIVDLIHEDRALNYQESVWYNILRARRSFS